MLCTQNLLKALNVKPVERTQPPAAKLGDWYAKLVETVAGDLIVCMSAPIYLSVAIPYPLDDAAFLSLAARVGLVQPEIRMRSPSTFLGEMYTGVAFRPATD